MHQRHDRHCCMGEHHVVLIHSFARPQATTNQPQAGRIPGLSIRLVFSPARLAASAVLVSPVRPCLASPPSCARATPPALLMQPLQAGAAIHAGGTALPAGSLPCPALAARTPHLVCPVGAASTVDLPPGPFHLAPAWSTARAKPHRTTGVRRGGRRQHSPARPAGASGAAIEARRHHLLRRIINGGRRYGRRPYDVSPLSLVGLLAISGRALRHQAGGLLGLGR